MAARLSEQTVSLWMALDQPATQAEFTNPYYRPLAAALPLSSDSRTVTFQAGLYAPWLVPTQLQTQLRHHGQDPALQDLAAEWARLQAEVATLQGAAPAPPA